MSNMPAGELNGPKGRGNEKGDGAPDCGLQRRHGAQTRSPKREIRGQHTLGQPQLNVHVFKNYLKFASICI